MGRVGTGRWRVLFAAILIVSIVAGLPEVARAEPPAAAEIFAVRVPILAYHAVDYSGSPHSVTPEQLDEQCRWLVEQGYTPITLWQFWAAATGTGTLPAFPVVLTNDDGWLSAMTFAEVLGRYGLTGNYFINNTSPLAPEQIHQLSLHGPVQAHTASHANLRGLNYEAQLAEIVDNKVRLEGITGQPVSFLAWPYGDSDSNAVQAAAASGIVAAFGLMGTAANTGALDPYYVPRIMIGVEDDIHSFSAKVTSW